METSSKKLTASDLSAYLEPLDLDLKAQKDKALLENYRAAAAVLAAIREPSSLRPLSGEEGLAETILGPELVPTAASRVLGGNKMLSYEVRCRALQRLGSREAMLKALEANPHERQGPIQVWFEKYLKGDAPPLTEQSPDELDQSLQAVLWLDGLNLPGVPSADEARVAVARAKFLQPFERLAGAHFQGRSKELDKLRNFVGVLEPETVRGRISAGIARLRAFKPKPALTIYGPGGIGKTALVMRFFLDHISQPEERRVPFAYLDFDSPFLNINDLSTLVAEIFRQLKLQSPKLDLPDVPTNPLSVSSSLAELLRRLSSHVQQPFLIVLDTFEEIQYGGEARAIPLWDMLNSLQAQWPFLRVLISGRAPVEQCKLAGQAPDQLLLEGLDEEAALAIVTKAGLQDRDIAQALVKQVGRVPLSLRLAASLVQKEGAGLGGVKDLETTSYFFLSLSDEVIQGQLYERILGHIHHPEVVKLAHPGLVLRRVNPDLILKVLKEPCGLSVATIDPVSYTHLTLPTNREV